MKGSYSKDGGSSGDKVKTSMASSKETAGNGGMSMGGGPDWMLGKSKSKSGKEGETRKDWSKPRNTSSGW